MNRQKQVEWLESQIAEIAPQRDGAGYEYSMGYLNGLHNAYRTILHKINVGEFGL